MSLGGSELKKPQPFSVVLGYSANAIGVEAAELALCRIKALRCSQPIKRSRLGIILRKSSLTILMQQAERVLPVSATLPCTLERQLQRSRLIQLASIANMPMPLVAQSHHTLAMVAARARTRRHQLKRSIAILCNV